ncbi:MAG: tRNA (adenosine(37)-N6)-dimethylallyltransferase MiaA [Erysipelotrichaceae bacterium]
MSKVLVIIGPTAVGKTALSIKLAQEFNGEIISGDSAQVYRDLNIGSAKITEKQKQGIKHHLIDILDYNENYSVYDFQKKARELINKINNKGKLPIIVGGTGLYIKALLYDYQFPEKSQEYNNYQNQSNEELWQLLRKKDANAADKVHVNNRQRLITNLNLLDNISGTKTELLAKQDQAILYDALVIGLTIEREELHKRINKRVDLMFEEGLLEEVKNLNKDSNFFNTLASKAIGYKEFKEYFNQNQDISLIKEKIKTHTRQFAKRQYTYFNNQMSVNWFEINAKNCYSDIELAITDFIKKK